jgi:hypothetical protein
MFNKKQSIILLILILILIGAIFLYWRTYQRWPWQKGVSVASPTATVSPPESSSPAPQPKTVREKIMNDLAVKIAQISPVEPVLGGHWFVDRFWFVNGSDKDVYVEYEDGHILRRVLLTIAESNGSFKYTVAAYFESGESDWVLKSGQDTQFGKSLDLYEYNEVKKEWVKKN